MLIRENAIKFLSDKIKGKTDTHVYIFVTYPFTKYAHVNINFCKINEINIKDILLYDRDFKIYLEKSSNIAMQNAVIDIKNNQLYVNAPNIYEKNIESSQDLKFKIKFLFENEINVMLSQHGGFIELVDIINQDTIIIRFHGGCQGCGMIGYTLNNYIEKIIKKNFPSINKINDVTAHEIRTNSYY